MMIFAKNAKVEEMQECRKKKNVHCKKIYVEFVVETMEGEMRGKPGDYLMRGIKGELYPCDKTVFEESYELV